jgi:hypothetical protein
MDRGFPVVAPRSQTQLDPALKELELRVSAFEKVRGELDPESLRAGGELAASFTDLAEAMKRKPPPPEAAEPPPSGSEEPPSPLEDRPRRLRVLAASASASAARPRASAAPSASAGLYDTSAWDQQNERLIAAWKAVATLCP